VNRLHQLWQECTPLERAISCVMAGVPWLLGLPGEVIAAVVERRRRRRRIDALVRWHRYGDPLPEPQPPTRMRIIE